MYVWYCFYFLISHSNKMIFNFSYISYNSSQSSYHSHTKTVKKCLYSMQDMSIECNLYLHQLNVQNSYHQWRGYRQKTFLVILFFFMLQQRKMLLRSFHSFHMSLVVLIADSLSSHNIWPLLGYDSISSSPLYVNCNLSIFITHLYTSWQNIIWCFCKPVIFMVGKVLQQIFTTYISFSLKFIIVTRLVFSASL